MTIRTYSDLILRESFRGRFDYLALPSRAGVYGFGLDRYVNQKFYRSREWRQLRHDIIARDSACDLGVEGREIFYGLTVHHMNSMTVEDIRHGNDDILNPEFLITTTHQTHNAIHFGDANLLAKGPDHRKRGDTTLWSRRKE